MTCNVPINDGANFFYHRADGWKQPDLLVRILLQLFGFLESDSCRTSNHQREVCAACRFICRIHHLPILEDGNTCGASADIHDCAIADLQYIVRSGRLIDEACAVQARAVQYIGSLTS